MKEILKVTTAGTGNEKLTDIFNTKRHSVFPVLKTLKKSLRRFAHLRHKYVVAKSQWHLGKEPKFSIPVPLQKFRNWNSEDVQITHQT